MACVQEIETSVGEHKFLTLRGILLTKGRKIIGRNKSIHETMGNPA
jgi:hypothetical protein